MPSVFDLTVRAADGSPHPLAQYRGRVLLVVNTASRCGFTPQYEGLESLFLSRSAAGLSVIAFPCNQFGKQEPGDAAEIARFCSLTYAVTFPVMAKVDVNGPRAEPLFDYLTRAKPGFLGSRKIKWNFTKFLVGRDGRVLQRFAPAKSPASLSEAIDGALAA
ncbi:glutathione peroxidase [Methylobacterium aerolatum]|uniref:Glutathione peroxidase n=1 Tax=Methylobacterium aerolatum TaxID=418708 RepID=A0ABU0I049_9HYPH|nr:glutathione peroxidase [Methylobacterium aerolatum]MDQ0447418.1 glutathione peroxidase [Methylobacterium aerolatum]GJD34169.1 Glutathione peroxidase BsaA [Methylobacterium aerolatum]